MKVICWQSPKYGSQDMSENLIKDHETSSLILAETSDQDYAIWEKVKSHLHSS